MRLSYCVHPETGPSRWSTDKFPFKYLQPPRVTCESAVSLIKITVDCRYGNSICAVPKRNLCRQSGQPDRALVCMHRVDFNVPIGTIYSNHVNGPWHFANT